VTPQSPFSSELARIGNAASRLDESNCLPKFDFSLLVGKRSSCQVSSAHFSNMYGLN
jgi:hypothetical protein